MRADTDIGRLADDDLAAADVEPDKRDDLREQRTHNAGDKRRILTGYVNCDAPRVVLLVDPHIECAICRNSHFFILGGEPCANRNRIGVYE